MPPTSPDRPGAHQQEESPPALHFAFRFSGPFRWAAAPFGISPGTTGVVVADGELLVRFGPWRLATPLANIASVAVTGPYSWPKTIGPPHLSLADRGLTFATNDRAGVCVRFEQAVPGLLPRRLLAHPAVTVTVEEPGRLAEVLDVAAREERPAAVPDLLDDVHTSLGALTTAELRARARELGIRGTSRMKKAELVEALEPETGPGPA